MELNSSQEKQEEEEEEHREEAQVGGDGGPLSPAEGDGGAAVGQALGPSQPLHPDATAHTPGPDPAPVQVERPPPLCATPPPSSTASKQEEYGLEICPSDFCPGEEACTEPPADTGTRGVPLRLRLCVSRSSADTGQVGFR